VIDFIEVWNIFLQTFWQATFSSLFSIVVGFFIALGLINIRSQKALTAFEFFFISPQILPTLFVLLSVYQIYAVFETAPAGFLDIVMIHVIINAGFSGVQLSHILKTKIGGFAELAQVEGASALQFFKTTLPYLKKDLLQLFFTIFVFCFLSFSIPVVVGGRASETLEILIYKKIIAENLLTAALLISLMQFVLLALVGALINARMGVASRLQCYRTVHYGSRFFIVLPVLAISLIYFFALRDFVSGASEILRQKIVLESLIQATFGSLVTGLIAGLSVFVLTLILAYFLPKPILSKILFVVTPPSVVFVGLTIFIIGWTPIANFSGFALLGVCLALLSFFTLYRFGISSLFDGISHQIQVAQSLGASRFLIFKSVVMPQLIQHLCYFSGVAAFWAAGDFALSLFIVPIESNLALFVKMLISRYKLEMATAVIWWMMAVGLFIFLLFKGVGRVAYKRLN
jgi:thiamine transport system permease protein